MMGARKAGLLSWLINDQMLPSILAKMPPSDWHQWARERPTWMREAIEEAFWNFVDQKWRDALNVAAAEPPIWGTGSGRGAPQEGENRGGMAEAKKPVKASVHVMGLDGKRHHQGDSGRKCMFADVMGCQGTHPPWHCKVFGKLQAKERERIKEDNQLCPFCLLHDKAKPCGAKQRPVNPACRVPNCKGRHIQKLHDFLKDVFKEENQVHMVHGDNRWEESEEAWEVGEEEEMIIVGTIQREDSCSWQDASRSWLEQDGEEEDGVYLVGTCRGASNASLETGKKEDGVFVRPPMGGREDAKAVEDSWWAPGPEDLMIEGEEGEYFLELLMREASLEESNPAGNKVSQPARKEGNSKGKGEKKDKKKTPRGEDGATTQPERKEAGGQKKEGRVASQPDKQARAAPLDPLINPEAKGGGLPGRGQPETRPGARLTTTSRGECSGQEKPDP